VTSGVRTDPGTGNRPGADVGARTGATPGRGLLGRVARADPRTVALHAGVIGGFLLVSVLTWWHVWVSGAPTSTVACQCGDVSEALNFLAWPPWAVLHGHNPFFSNAIYAGQGGANMLTNASWMAGAVALSPITVLFGPVASLNVAVTLAPVFSGWCFFLAVRRFTRFVPGQVVAAALYGFSPIIVDSEPYGHFFQIWLFYPPLAFLCLYDLFVSRRHRPVPLGIGLGLLTVVQFFVGTEVLVITVVMAAIGGVFGAALAPRQAWALRRRALAAFTATAATAVPFLAYPVWFALGGPAHIVGAAWPGTTLSGLPPLSLVQAGPGVDQASNLTRLAGYWGPQGPAISFVGFGVVAFLAVSVLVWYRKRMAWFLLGLGVCAWALSLGSTLQPITPSTDAVWLPWRVFAHLPVVSQVIPGRFSAITVFVAALLLAYSADSWWERIVDRRRHRAATGAAPARSRGMQWGGVVLAGVTALALVPLAAAYRFPYVIHKKPVPSWFRHVGPTLTPDTTLLVYPFPNGGTAEAMGWQAENDMRYRIIGGFAIVPGADGKHSEALSPFGGARLALDRLSTPQYGTLPPASPAQVGLVRQALRRWGARVVVVIRQGRDPYYAAGFLTAVLGRLPQVQDNALVWYGLGRAPPLRVPPEAVQTCEARFFKTHGLAIPRCVLAASTGTS